MCEEDELLENDLNLNNSVLSSPFDGLWLYDRHEYWEIDCDIETRMSPNHLLIKKFEGNNIEISTLLPRDHTEMYWPVPEGWVSWEPSRLL